MLKKNKIVAFVAMISFVISTTMVAIPEGNCITIQEERELSREFMAVVRTQFPLIEDPIIVDYVNRLGQRILASVAPQPFDYQFHVIQEDVYNAFATPAGHIFFNSGLFAALESEEELAGIIGHEIAHVVGVQVGEEDLVQLLVRTDRILVLPVERACAFCPVFERSVHIVVFCDVDAGQWKPRIPIVRVAHVVVGRHVPVLVHYPGWIIAGIAAVGYGLAFGSSVWANVDRKRLEFSVLRLTGFRTRAIVWFPIVQAVLTGVLGWLVAVLVFFVVQAGLNSLFADTVGGGESVCRLLPGHFVLALVLTLVAASVAAALGGRRLAMLEPSLALREA